MTTAREPSEIRIAGTRPQLEFWQSKAKFRAFVGGIGSGKTYASAVEVLSQPAGSRGAIVAPTYPMLRDAFVETMLEVAEKGDGHRGVLAKYNRSDMVMTFTNGTQLLLRSADVPDRLRGPNLGWFGLDEGALMQRVVWDLMIGRLRQDPGRAWVTTTPRGLNWLYELFVKAGDPSYQLVQCRTFDNTYLSNSYITSLMRRYTGSWRQQEIEGGFVAWSDNPAYHEYDESRNTVVGLADLYQPHQPLCLCCDFNHRIMAWPIGQRYRDRPIVLAEAVVQGRGRKIEDAVREFRRLFPDHPGGVWVYGDASGRSRSAQTGESDYELLERAFEGYSSHVEIYVPRANPPVIDRLNAVNNALRGEPEWNVDGLLIDDECAVLKLDLGMVEMADHGKDVKKVTDPDDEASLLTHASDALGYWIHMEWPATEAVMSIRAIKDASRQAYERSRMPVTRQPLVHKDQIGVAPSRTQLREDPRRFGGFIDGM